MKKIVAFGVLFTPAVAFAIKNTDDLRNWFQWTLSDLATLILAAAVVYFLWGVFQFVKAAGDEKARESGKQQIIYGIIGIAVMVSIWGLVNFFTSSADLNTTAQQAPEIKF